MKKHMFRAIGLLIVLWGFSHYFSNAFVAFDEAAEATFQTVEVAAEVSQVRLQELK